MLTNEREGNDPEVPGAQALLRGLDVLLAIGNAHSPMRLKDLERTAGIPKGSLHRLVSALSKRRLVRFDSRSRTYHLGVKVLELARAALDRDPLIRVAKPELARLARRLGRTIVLSVMDESNVFVLDFEAVDPVFTSLAHIWPRGPAIDSAAGRAMIAALSKSDQIPFLEAASASGIRQEKLAAELSVAKAVGYIVVPREPASGGPAVAAPIVDDSDRPIGAIGCTFDADVTPSEELHEAGRIMAEAARRASGKQGTSLVWPEVIGKPEKAISPDLQVLPTGRDFMGENPIWCEDQSRLYWVDVLAPALRWWEPATRRANSLDLPFLVGGVAIDDRGRLILAGQRGLHRVDLDTGETSRLIDPEPDQPDNRFNNAAIDSRGRLWAGTMAVNQQIGRGSLYCIDPHLNVDVKLSAITGPKNVAFSPDGARMYFTEGENAVVHVFSFNEASGALADRRVFIPSQGFPGKPNGLTVDEEGHVWVTCLGGWSIRRYAPDGLLVEEIALPVPMPTNCAFGGEDLSTLFVTSTFIRLPPGYSSIAPESGRVIAIKTKTRGQQPQRFLTKTGLTDGRA